MTGRRTALVVALVVAVVALGAAVALTWPDDGDDDVAATTTTTPTTTTSSTTAATTVEIWFVDAVDIDRFLAVPRAVPETRAVLRAALEALVAGPTPDEDDRGLHSIVPNDPGFLRDVSIDEAGVAVVDLASAPLAGGGVGTSAGTGIFLGQLDRTVFQFSTVTAVVYRLDGSCEAFWSFLGLDPECPHQRDA